MKMDCDIIKDLLPSYADGICSEASKECVEAHMAECEECRKFLEECREVEFSLNKLEERELDGLRKVKRKIRQQSLVSYGLLWGVLLFIAYVFAKGGNTISVGVYTEELWWYYVLFPVVLVATFFATLQGKRAIGNQKTEKALLSVSAGAILYEVLWVFFIMASAVKENIPFGLEVYQVGPFLHVQIGVAVGAEILVFGYSLVSYMRKGAVCQRVLLCCLTGMFLGLAYTSWMGNLSDLGTSMKSGTELTVVILGIGVISGLVLWCVERFRGKI